MTKHMYIEVPIELKLLVEADTETILGAIEDLAVTAHNETYDTDFIGLTGYSYYPVRVENMGDIIIGVEGTLVTEDE